MELIFIIIAFLLLILVVVWAPFIKQQQSTVTIDDTQRDETNVRLYHEHKAEIEKDFQQNNIDDENYQYLLTELDNTLLQDMENQDIESNTPQEVKVLGFVWPVGLSLFILGFSFYLYAEIGTYEKLTTMTPQAPMQQLVNPEQQVVNELKRLMEVTKTEPENSDAWYSLGQSLVNVGEFDGALKAYDQVLRIEGPQADIFGAKAQTVYYKNEQKIDSTVQGFIDQALTIDPNDPSTNILLGMHNFIAGNFQIAISHWQRVVDSDKKNVNKQALLEVIEEAKTRMANRDSKGGNLSEADESTTGPQLTVSVSLSDEILATLSQEDDRTVFIYAIPADTSLGRMPLAAIKLLASDLPITIILNDSRAMTPQAKLSDVDTVHIYAVVSALGGAGIKSGDFKAELNDVATSTTEPLNLVVSNIVP
ncbi:MULTISPECIES: c-type cytochrome biogenesis protein CcmI [unclassified Colwellia]|uniref:c-type cytochrome biogenesis protein CcmI n=1 Tax=unclassified Colwellia TaxID=196834 RepID=UPI0015F77B4C|nr:MULTISPECIES: c-type cytochrome biogenesis protein CcmI [unclassified Colwellia]MBA6230617.1 c-type cytochrome biogenesis protein CcmI [Colwellia sp. MB02u-7]MBA6234548.1 c-type cytochrome biogenesis protein CcmI [Colwellia sp. MB02u-11]MBA6255412.1 c-type cytochrome biogenesis protein CcmI [Colwellia sp. MB3u-28]MBA6261552.1 c-type cytochrome biogenesis protein CcmI [Colwellia sp. MB3u-41]MBA6301102.1 c-type cytochrome biogenesis protein CcmI [Colwellia sp. MB3u-22]